MLVLQVSKLMNVFELSVAFKDESFDRKFLKNCHNFNQITLREYQQLPTLNGASDFSLPTYTTCATWLISVHSPQYVFFAVYHVARSPILSESILIFAKTERSSYG